LAFAQKKAPASIKNVALSVIEDNVSKAYCATDETHNKLMKINLEYQQKFSKMNDNWQKWAIEKANGKNKKVEMVVTRHKLSGCYFTSCVSPNG